MTTDRPDLPGKDLQQFVLPPAVPGQQVGRGPFPTCSRVIGFGICSWIFGRFIPCMGSDSSHYLYKHAVSLGWLESWLLRRYRPEWPSKFPR
jgi:hypothetical protein